MVLKVNVIGAGLAGAEAAWQLANRNIQVLLYEMKPHKYSPAHSNENFAELVCSNSLRSDDYMNNAVGLLHQEMRLAKSLIMESADINKVPAGGALAVDRKDFSRYITEKIKQHPNITIIHEEVKQIPENQDEIYIIATGPLTSEALTQSISKLIGDKKLSFYDAIAPVIYKESIDFSKAWYQSRYDKGNKFDYINCPLTKEQYDDFVSEVLASEKVQFHDFEKATYFDGCLPIEVMAERGHDTLLYGPMKPVGLTNPNSTEKPYAVVQLRQDNKEDTLRNMVGFQTKLRHDEQIRIFRKIPGLEKAVFARLGGIHKNTFIKSPGLLDKFLRLKSMPHIMFAGQITGCEGYIESASIGWLAGYFAAEITKGKTPLLPPRESAFGCQLAHLTDTTNLENYQPMNINFGLFPELPKILTAKGKLRYLKGAEKKKMLTTRALIAAEKWLNEID
ncbi:MAG: methylenetetrahydrofolate--tRNA-(uracil(54)-C(5))-methyltransferase (FADH(2)-oxidizing) TrmFO [Alphaproteobacteria bacterium]|nr:methylenetetrahydrofolate--tRNA-(uracil(54)-C(5))-methyltransferase (FADH(2)-oxidizing) TrmFO [Alphaproteobacteria bacterium]